VTEAASPKVPKPKEYQEDDDEETEDESEEDDDEETEDESEEAEDEEQEEVPQKRKKGRGRGGRQVTKDSEPPKRKQRSAYQKKPPKRRRLGPVAATQTDAREAAQKITVLKAQVERLQMQVSSEQQHPTRELPGPQPHATHNTTAAAILRFTAQHMRANAVEVIAQMRADAVEELAAAITNTPQSEAVDSIMAHLQQTPGMPQQSEEVD
jgi:hypothetical protein